MMWLNKVVSVSLLLQLMSTLKNSNINKLTLCLSSPWGHPEKMMSTSKERKIYITKPNWLACLSNL